jgi:hypothetical protein
VQHLSKPPLALTVTAAFLAASVDGLFHVSLDRRHNRLAPLRGALELRRRNVIAPTPDDAALMILQRYCA